SKSTLCHPVVVWILHALLLGVVVCFSLALWKFYGVRGTGTTATEILEIRPADAGKETRAMLVRKLRRACRYLRGRNEAARDRFYAGRPYFSVGMALLLVA